MIIFKTIHQLKDHLDSCRNKKQKIGFVPTMGALHEGHISLIKTSKEENAVTVCSIFVNPVQFNDPKDFEKYPITIEKDIYMLESQGCDILFLPAVKEIYPDGFEKKDHYDLGYLENILEGKYRPGHFQGVCMVVDRLLNIVMPDRLYLGQKDFQQCMVIKKLIELKGMADKIETRICPIMREPDGLAMSSRNLRLNGAQRSKATIIYETLVFLKENFNKTSPDELKKQALKRLEQQGFRPDYVEIADPLTLMPFTEKKISGPAVGLIAAYLDEVRLIDNMMFD